MQFLSDALSKWLHRRVTWALYFQLNEESQKGKSMNHPRLLSCSETLASESIGLLGAVTRVFREARSSRSLVVIVLLIITLGFLNARTANAQVINYPHGFASSSGQIWLVNGASPLVGSTIQLTTSGSVGASNNAWYETPVNVQAFTTTFTFTDTCSSYCGNGFGFMIISTSNPSPSGFTYSGNPGGQLSWSQCGGTGNTDCPAINSILVKFDLFDAQAGSPGANLTGFYSGGTYPQAPNNPQYDMSGSGINMESGDLFTCTITYDGSSLTETLTDTVTEASYTKTYTGINIPSLVGGNTAYVGFGGSTGAATVTQSLSSWTYTEESPGQAGIPTFSPPAGTYLGSQSVTLSSGSSGAVICYSTTGNPKTNGSNSCATGTLYTGPVTVSSSETLFAVAGGTGYNDSSVVSGSYVIQGSVATPVFSPPGGNYTAALSVSISDVTSNATIYYTTDGTPPTASSTKYTAPITVSSMETLEAIAVGPGNTNSAVASAAYTITPPIPVATPTFSPIGGTYTSAQSVTISDATSGATIYYTTDGSTPTTSSANYIGPITVGSTETLEAIAAVTGGTSAVGTASYTINVLPVVATPTFSPAAGTYTSTQSVTISDATSGATIYYTTDGSTPTTSSAEYTGPIAISSTETLKAIAAATGENNSAVASAAYTITPPARVATPAFSPAAGTYTSTQSVTISDATSGATIYYTSNGTTPGTSSTAYTGPITVSSTETLEAIAVATGYTDSTVASAVYTISPVLPSVATPTFSPAAGTYTSAQTVTISDATSGATIYYTTNGNAPTTSSTAYTGPITVSSTETLEAIAVAAGDSNSAVASAAYTINAIPNFTLGASPASLTVESGDKGTVTLSVTPANGFNSPVSFACSGLPAGATCSFAPATVTPAGAAATTQLTISASAQSSALHPGSRPLLPLTTLAVTVCFFGWRRRRWWHNWLILAVGCAGLGLLFGCGGSNGGGTTSPSSTPMATTSTVTVTATSGTLQGTATITLTLN
jgi:Chitobiase/beta-hexosaminidase C-terminal domain/Legume lectin domain